MKSRGSTASVSPTRLTYVIFGCSHILEGLLDMFFFSLRSITCVLKTANKELLDVFDLVFSRYNKQKDLERIRTTICILNFSEDCFRLYSDGTFFWSVIYSLSEHLSDTMTEHDFSRRLLRAVVAVIVSFLARQYKDNTCSLLLMQ